MPPFPMSGSAHLGAILLLAACRAPASTADGDWPAYGRTQLGDRHSPLRQITRENVGQLAVAWRYHTGEMGPAFAGGPPTMLEVTPIVTDGMMYLATPLGRVIALDPVTGEQRWSYDPALNRKLEFGDFANRGVSVWQDSLRGNGPCGRRVFVATIDGRLIALDARSGARCADFSRDGVVHLVPGLRNPPDDSTEYEETSPPAIINGLVIVGSAVADNGRIDASSGEVRAFDARTGALRWTWDPVPQDPADPGYPTWIGSRAHTTGAANAWSVLAADPSRDLVFIPTGSPSVDYFGGARKGANRYANSIVALRASTGKVVWHLQTVHHDLWDYDNASPPSLVTLKRDGRDIPAVVQATKTGQLFVLDRETGRPIFPVEERPAPASDVPGEESWPTQPASSGLPPLSPQRLTEDDVWGPTPADRDACRARLKELRNDGTFTPPSIRGSMILPSNVGGAHWGGVAYDPEHEIVVVPTNRIAAVITLIPRTRFESVKPVGKEHERIGTEYAGMRGTPFVLKRETFLGPSNAPCTPPPFGALVAISLRSGKALWTTPLGTGEGLERLGLHLGPDVQGMFNLGGAITTAGGLVFVAASPDAYLRGFDIETGRELWKGKLPAGGKATPMTYLGRDGRQYLVIAAGGDGELFGRADEIIAFALPPLAGKPVPAQIVRPN